jgi:hypothetical protein
MHAISFLSPKMMAPWWSNQMTSKISPTLAL